MGFSPAGAAPPWLPIPAEWAGLCVQAQAADPDSMWSFYRAALAVRRAEPALHGPAVSWLDSPPGTLAFRRDAGGRALCCAVNTGPRSSEVHLPGTPRLWAGPVAAGADGSVSLPPDSAVWTVF
jgi:alpha-glucosidase